jgi:hypothetical protein
VSQKKNEIKIVAGQAKLLGVKPYTSGPEHPVITPPRYGEKRGLPWSIAAQAVKHGLVTGKPKLDDAMDWDTGDLDTPARRSPPPSPGNRPKSLSIKPEVNPDWKRYTPGVSSRALRPKSRFDQQREAADPPTTRSQRTKSPTAQYPTISNGVPQQVPPEQSATPRTPTAPTRAPRSKTPTTQFQVTPGTPMQPASLTQARAQMGTPPQGAQTNAGEHSWDVYVNGAGVYKVPAADEETAKQRTAEWLNGGGDPQQAGKQFAPTAFQAVRGTATDEGVGAAAMGGQPQMPQQDETLDRLREMINARIRETVRKVKDGFGLYDPKAGKGNKKKAKKVGTFPTRLAAKEAELNRFPPKDPEKLAKARANINKLKKDPKARAAAEKKDRIKRVESLTQLLSNSLSERLFREDEIPGSPWDERISSLHPDAISSDKKLHSLHKGMEVASIGALGDAHKGLSKALKGMAKIHPGEIAHDPQRKKTFMPVMLDCDGTEVGPVHLYIDGGHVKIEVSADARQQIADMEPDDSKLLRGGLMSFEEDHLPNITKAKDAWNDRDSYLDKMHGKLQKHVGNMSDVEMHLAKQMLGGRSKRR